MFIKVKHLTLMSIENDLGQNGGLNRCPMESSATWQGDVNPTGSKTVAWYQTENMGTRETRYALPKGECDIKPINGKILQIAFRESDQFVVLMKQGNSCGGKGLTEVRVTLGSHLTHSEVRIR